MRFLSILTLIVLVGCSSSSGDVNTILDATHTPGVEAVDEQYVTFNVADVAVVVHRPQQWEYYTTQYGVVLAESLGSVAVDGRLGGLLTHIFIPPLDEFTINAAEGSNRALTILNQVIQQPDYVGDAAVSDPIPFQWDAVDAAYYLMDNGEGNLTIVVGVLPANSTRLVAVSISAPEDQAGRIRQEIPLLLTEFRVNDLILNGEDLDGILPDPLNFPHHE